MFEISILGGMVLIAIITNMIFPSDDEEYMDKSYSEKKSNIKFYEK